MKRFPLLAAIAASMTVIALALTDEASAMNKADLIEAVKLAVGLR